MIYLILNMFVYLLLALLLGAAAGWLIRNIAATRREDELQKGVTEARARVPQFESLMRTRDEQVQRLRDELKAKEQALAEASAQLHGKDEEIRGKQRELGKLNARNKSLEGLPDSVDDAATMGMDVLDLTSGADQIGGGAEVASLREEVARLNRELTQANAAVADAVSEAAAAEAELVSLKAQLARTATAASARSTAPNSEGDVKELEARLRQKAQEQEKLNRALETEQRRVVELERERELQNKSLQVLHQQLELERERNAATRQSAERSAALQAARH